MLQGLLGQQPQNTCSLPCLPMLPAPAWPGLVDKAGGERKLVLGVDDKLLQRTFRCEV